MALRIFLNKCVNFEKVKKKVDGKIVFWGFLFFMKKNKFL